MKKIRKMLLGALTVALLGAVGCFTACKGEDSSFDSTESVESVVHTHQEYEAVVVQPTCEKDGYIEYHCESCPAILRTETLDALGHDIVEHEAQAPTCMEFGWDAYETCDREGCVYTTYEKILELGHDMETYSAQAATCTDIGWNAYEACEREGCGHTTYVEIPALTHDMKKYEAKVATCEEIGWEAYEACSREGCGHTTYVEIPALGHDLEYFKAQEVSCLEIGWDAYEVCNREGCRHSTYAEIPALEHDLCFEEKWDATCMDSGYEAYEYCWRCGYSTYQEIPALGHDIKTYEAKAVTCEEIGWDAYEACDREGCEHTTYEEIPAIGHDLEYFKAQAVSCLAIGWDAYEVCNRENCGHTTYAEIPALGHDMKGYAAKAVTCEEIGWEAYEACDREGCEHSTYAEIPALGHDMKGYEAKAATCTAIGWEVYEACDREGCEHSTFVEIPALGHDLEKFEAKAVSCLAIGWDAYEVCNREGCGHTTYREIPALGHALEYVSAQTATCTTIGWNDHEFCGRTGCGYTTYEEYPMVDHVPVADARVEATASQTGLTEGSHCGACGTVLEKQRTLYFLSLAVYNGEYGTVAEYQQSLAAGEKVKMKAIPYAEYGFSGWYLNNQTQKLTWDCEYEYTMPSRNTTLKAVFSMYPDMDVWFGDKVTTFSGSGLPSNPYLIETGAQLAGMASLVNAGNKSYISAYYRLEKSIDMNGNYWAPIGSNDDTYEAEFEGDFNGNDNVVYGMKLREINGVNYYGLFGGLHPATVYDLNIENVNIDITGYSDKIYYVGALCGFVYNSDATLNNVTASGTIKLVGGKEAYVGGVIGCSNGMLNVKNFTSATNIQCNLSQAYVVVGGVLGYAKASINMYGCSHKGDITVSGSTECDAGGVLGEVGGANRTVTLELCNHTGVMDVTSVGLVDVGGVAGHSGKFTRCFASGNLSVSTGDKSIAVGGIASHGGTATNCYYAGNITTYNGDANFCVGGIFGDSGSAEKVITSGSISVTNGDDSKSITSDGFAAGIIGYTSGGTLTNCATSMSVNITNTEGIKDDQIGYISTWRYTYENCYASSASALYQNGELATDVKGFNTFEPSNNFKTSGFYSSTLRWSSSIWDWSTVTTLGYPVLKA